MSNSEPTDPAPSPPPTEAGQVVEQPDAGQLQHFVTTIKTAEQQVGENIIQALQHEGTVAVLTTVVMGPDGQQRVVSAALNPTMVDQVKSALQQAQQEREEDEPCIGFHCFTRPKQTSDKESSEADPS